MHPRDRVKLLLGPYLPPRTRPGRSLVCHLRGKVTVRSISDAPIQWPCTWRHAIDRRPSIILCGDLVRAVRTESAAPIMYHWGVGHSTLAKWPGWQHTREVKLRLPASRQSGTRIVWYGQPR